MAVILTNSGKVAGPRNPIDVKVPLFVVRDADQHPDGAMLVCRICASRGEESKFYPDEIGAYERHVTRCYTRHEAELRGRSLKVQNPLLYDEDIDDVAVYIRKNREAIIRGEKKL